MFCCAPLSQNITTTPGGIYTLDFWFRNPQASISVSWNGTLIFSASAGAASEYTHKMFPNLAATTNSTPLTFSPSGGVGAGMFLNDVNVVVQPCTITCPANVTQGNDNNSCGAVVN